jgi:hypothetical protein
VSATSKASATEQSIPILVKVLCPLLTNHELGELKYVVGVTCVMVQKGFFACLRDLEDYVVHLGRVIVLTPFVDYLDTDLFSFLRSHKAHICSSYPRASNILGRPRWKAPRLHLHATVVQFTICTPRRIFDFVKLSKLSGLPGHSKEVTVKALQWRGYLQLQITQPGSKTRPPVIV